MKITSIRFFSKIDLERNLLLAALSPILWLQSRHVRRNAPRLPEAAGPRQGAVGCANHLKILVIGDSGAAGVGVQHMNEGLCGQLVALIGQERSVSWAVIASNGLDSAGMIKLLEFEPTCCFDVVVLCLGANDATALCSPARWLSLQELLVEAIKLRFNPRVLVHSAVPPMHDCQALPQPLRWFMGRWAAEMNQRLAESINKAKMGKNLSTCKRSIHWHPKITDAVGMAVDGIHPSAAGYADWARTLSVHVEAELTVN
jgi:lysophospholipase L1-like esterase